MEQWNGGGSVEIFVFLFCLVFPCFFLVFRPSVVGFFGLCLFFLVFFLVFTAAIRNLCVIRPQSGPPPPQKESLCRGRELRMTEETDEETKEEEDDDDDEAEDDDETSRKHAWILEPG